MAGKNFGSNGIGCIVWIIIILVVLFISGGSGNSSSSTSASSNHTTSSHTASTTSESTKKEDPDANLTPQDEPDSGMVLDGSEWGDSRISVSASSNGSAYVKVLNPDGSTQATFFVRAGETGAIEVPSGTYDVHFAQGKTWYGPEDRFGSKTAYGKDDGVELPYGTEIQYSLTLTTFGNFSMDHLSEEDF